MPLGLFMTDGNPHGPATFCQLFLEVTAKKESNCCSTRVLLHLGQRAFFLSCSLTLMRSENLLAHFLQTYSYVGI